MKGVDLSDKAAILYSLIGDHLPSEALSLLSAEEIQKLMDKLGRIESVTTGEETSVLAEFSNNFSVGKGQISQTQNGNELSFQLHHQIDKIIEEGLETNSTVDELKHRSKKELDLLIKDEKPRMVAITLCFANPDIASHVIEELPEKFREKVLIEINQIDFHSPETMEELERFLRFKNDLIESDSLVSKIQNRGGRKAAEILARLNPNLSHKLVSKIKEINPEYAEHINEHLYNLHDLLNTDRTSLSRFLSSFNPIVVAFAFKGIESSIAERLLDKCEPWLAKSIRLEMDCMGPITLAEIEEAQKGILDGLHKSIDSGDIKLWKG